MGEAGASPYNRETKFFPGFSDNPVGELSFCGIPAKLLNYHEIPSTFSGFNGKTSFLF